MRAVRLSRSSRRAGPAQMDERPQQQRLRDGVEQRVGMPAMMQQVAERFRQQRRQEEVEVGEIAGGPAGEQEQTPPQALVVLLADAVALLRQAAMQQFADREAGDRVTQIIHRIILHGLPAYRLFRRRRRCRRAMLLLPGLRRVGLQLFTQHAGLRQVRVQGRQCGLRQRPCQTKICVV